MKFSGIEKIGFIGAGKMAEGIIKGLIESDLIKAEEIIAADIDAERLQTLHKKLGILTMPNRELAQTCHLLFLSIKPQQADAVFQELEDISFEDKLVLSIMAGVPTHRIENGLGKAVHVIRIMPNIAATVQAAASAFCLGKWATQKDATLARTILETFGTAEQIDESLLDAVTGLSGSGPAYVFSFIEALADGGVLMGLSRKTALNLAIQTVYGAAKLILETGDHPALLKEKVTSPGGTTIHGLAKMEEAGFRNALIQGVKRATERSQELGKE